MPDAPPLSRILHVLNGPSKRAIFRANLKPEREGSYNIEIGNVGESSDGSAANSQDQTARASCAGACYRSGVAP
jgi:hypothetical protein